MHLTNVYGSYVPSYLLIKLNTEQPLDEIALLDKEDQRTFFHEYTHFLQNIGGGFGHSHIWNTYDRLRQVVSDVQKSPEPILSLPVTNAVTETQEKYRRLMQVIAGSYKVNPALSDDSANVIAIEEYRHPNYDELYPGTSTTFIRLDLQDTSRRIRSYHFGESAVSETMTYLLEKKMFGEKKLGNYPYEACQRLCDHLGTTLHHNEEWLFVICDVAMLSSFPGRMFYMLVKELYQSGYQPESSEKLFDKCLGILYNNKWNIWEDFEYAMNGASYVLGKLFYLKEFAPTLEWIQYILTRGYEYRKANRFFTLELYRAKMPYEGEWINVNKEFGTPQLHNALHQRYFRAPAILKPMEKQIEPLWLLSLQHVHDTLVHAKIKCGLYEVCDNLQTGSVTDYDCVTQPWERAKRNPLCAYAAIWTAFMLTGKQVEYGPT